MKMSREAFMGVSRKAGAFDAKALVFQDKMVMKGGLGDHTYLPDAMHASPPVPSMALAREEAEIVMFTAVRDALAAANLRATDVDCVVVNCSLFNPTPSLAAMLVNHFKMRSDVVSYSLSGMGCSAGVISIALARELLQTYKNSTCLVVATVRSFFFFLFRVFSFRFLFFQSFSLFLSSSLTLLSRSLSSPRGRHERRPQRESHALAGSPGRGRAAPPLDDDDADAVADAQRLWRDAARGAAVSLVLLAAAGSSSSSRSGCRGVPCCCLFLFLAADPPPRLFKPFRRLRGSGSE